MTDASFGFRTVAKEAKQGLVSGVFSSVARRYDLMNDLMSGGIHRLWKDAMVEWLNPQADRTYLDVAGGTGDVAFRIEAALARRGRKPKGVTICDINPDMMNEGLRRGEVEHSRAQWVCGDASSLPLTDASFDAYTVAFGIRNVTDLNSALREARRVLKVGGRFLCLEFSRVEAPGIDALYDSYSFSVLPRLGQLVAGDAEAYRYLVESIRRFPPQAQFARMIAQAGFCRVKVRNLSAGIAALHSAWKL